MIPSAQLQLFEPRDDAFGWQVRVSRRARRLSVRVYPGGRVEVVAPPGASAAAIQRFVGSHRQWIDARVADLSAVAGPLAELQPHTIHLTAIDRTIAVDYRRVDVGATRLSWTSPDRLLVCGARLERLQIVLQLRAWLAALAQQELTRALQAQAQQHGFNFSRLQIRRQRTRWGSCSASGTISLNVCVLFQEPAVMRYLLLHELSHTRHMNHSRRFWALVETLEPDYKRLDRELSHGWQRVPGWMFG